MAIEVLLGANQSFVHKPQHDLESILYIILYICTFVQGPGLPLYEPNTHRHPSPPIRSWFSSSGIKEIGFRKMTHLDSYEVAILPNFTPYWHDFAPFVESLILACFPVKPWLPNEFNYEQALMILEKAYAVVEEPSDPANPASEIIEGQNPTLKRPNSGLSLRDSGKKGKHRLTLPS